MKTFQDSIDSSFFDEHVSRYVPAKSKSHKMSNSNGNAFLFYRFSRAAGIMLTGRRALQQNPQLERNTEVANQQELTRHRGTLDHQVSVSRRSRFVKRSWELHAEFKSRRNIARTFNSSLDGIKKFQNIIPQAVFSCGDCGGGSPGGGAEGPLTNLLYLWYLVTPTYKTQGKIVVFHFFAF